MAPLPLPADDGARLVPVRLKKRPDFLRAGAGRKAHSALFTVQATAATSVLPAPPRVGFTVTKKVGHAVERNRIKRRLREVVRTTPDLGMKMSHDYVIVARRDLLTASFPRIVGGLEAAFRKVHAAPGSKTAPGSSAKSPRDVRSGA